MFTESKKIDAEVWQVVSYRLRYYFKSHKVMDLDNCVGSVKAVLDGIADTSGQDDRTFELKGVERFTDKENPRLEIILEVEILV